MDFRHPYLGVFWVAETAGIGVSQRVESIGDVFMFFRLVRVLLRGDAISAHF